MLIGVELEYGTDSCRLLRLGTVDVFTGEYALENDADIEYSVTPLVPDNGPSTIAQVLPVLGRGVVLDLAHATQRDGLVIAPLGHAAGDGRKRASMVRLAVVVRLLRYDDH